MTPLSPAAEFIWEAYNEVMERVGVFEDSGDAIAAAIRALVDQTAPLDRRSRRQCNIHRAQLAIAAELEGRTDG